MEAGLPRGSVETQQSREAVIKIGTGAALSQPYFFSASTRFINSLRE